MLEQKKNKKTKQLCGSANTVARQTEKSWHSTNFSDMSTRGPPAQKKLIDSGLEAQGRWDCVKKVC